jgi:hypothetical protein
MNDKLYCNGVDGLQEIVDKWRRPQNAKTALGFGRLAMLAVVII